MKHILWLFGALLLLSACGALASTQPEMTATPAAAPLPELTSAPTFTPTPDSADPVPEIVVTAPPAAPTPTNVPLSRVRLSPSVTPTRPPPIVHPSPTRPAARETHVPILMFHHIAVAPPNADAI